MAGILAGASSALAVTNTWYTTKAAAFAAAKAAGVKRIFIARGRTDCRDCDQTRFFWCESTDLNTGADGLKYSAKGLIEAHYICWYCNEDVSAYRDETDPYYQQTGIPFGYLPHTWIIDVASSNPLDVTAGIQYPQNLVTRFTTTTNRVANAFTNWAALEGIPVPQRGITNCPAGDGIPNLLKYVCGLPATNRCASSDLMQATTTNGTREVIYYKSTNAVLAVVEPLWANSFTRNAMTNSAITNIYLGTEGGRQKWKAVLPSSSPQSGARLRADQK